MRLQKTDLQNHTGSLLVALPTLLDPNFRRTILFLTHHDSEEGAMGFILNRPREENLEDLATAPEGLAGVPVFEGGPIEKSNLILTRLLWKENGVRFQSLGEEDFPENSPQDVFDHDSLRAFTGYAGWSAGQLEREIAEKSWLTLRPTSAMLLPILAPGDGVTRWKAIMKELGPWYHLLAQAPDDPSLN